MDKSACDRPGISRTPIFRGNYSFNTGIKHGLSLIDYTILIITLVITLIMGMFVFWKERLNKCINDYALVGRSLIAAVASLSIGACFSSGITALGLPGTVYMTNTMDVWFIVPAILATSVATSVTVPVFYQLKVTSINEYLELRFNRGVRMLGYTWFVMYSIIYISIVLHIPSVTLQSVSGLDSYQSLLTVGVVCIAYTAIGSTRAVVYADVFQFIVMILGLIIVLVKANGIVGGFSVMLDSAKRTDRLVLDNFSLDPRDSGTFWTITGAYFQQVLYVFGTNQIIMHRCLSCQSLWDARMALWINVFITWTFMTLCITLALYGAAFYENCDPIQAELIKKSFEIVPFFVSDSMSDTTGLMGIYTAVILCATVSTASSIINSTAVITLEDLVRMFSKQHIESHTARRMIRVISVVFGFIAVECAFLLSKIKGDIFLFAMTALGSVNSSILAVFMMGLLIPSVNTKGVRVAILGGTLFTIGLFAAKNGVKSPIPPPFAVKCISNCNITIFTNLVQDENKMIPKSSPPSNTNVFLTISSRYTGLLSTIFAIVCGVIASWFTGFQDPQQIDPVLIVPFLDEVFPFFYLPDSFRQKFRFGIDHTDKWEKWNLKNDNDEKDKFLRESEEPEIVSDSAHGTPVKFELIR